MIEERYRKNNFSEELQNSLLDTTVAVIGLGGCGGFIVEHLARLGVKKIIIFDGDNFEESNLNRQRFCDVWTVGYPKAIIVKQELIDINPNVDIIVVNQFFKNSDYVDLLLKNKTNIIINASDCNNMTEGLEDALNTLFLKGIPIIDSGIYKDRATALIMTKKNPFLWLKRRNELLYQSKNNLDISQIQCLSHYVALSAALVIELFLAYIKNPLLGSKELNYFFIK